MHGREGSQEPSRFFKRLWADVEGGGIEDDLSLMVKLEVPARGVVGDGYLYTVGGDDLLREGLPFIGDDML